MKNFITIRFFTKMPNKGANKLFQEWDFFWNGGSNIFVGLQLNVEIVLYSQLIPALLLYLLQTKVLSKLLVLQFELRKNRTPDLTLMFHLGTTSSKLQLLR